jgi:hypothetical protein
MLKIKIVKGLKIKFKGNYFDYLLNQLDDIHSQIEKIKKFGTITEDNYDEIMEEIEYFDNLVDDSRFEKHIPTKYYGLFTTEYSDAKAFKEQDEFNYCKYELGYSMEQLKQRFWVED